MSDLVSASDIERIVGVIRHKTEHYGRAVSDEETVYILHSRECLESGIDLRDCVFSTALDRGINMEAWLDMQDAAVRLGVWDRRLIPVRSKP